MRTTVDIDPEVLSAVRQIAAARSKSLGEVISELVRRGLASQARTTERSGFPVFKVSEGAPPLTPEDVWRAEDEA